MLMADTVAITMAVLGLLAGVLGLLLLNRGLWPGTVDRTETLSSSRRVAAFFTGLLVTGGTVTVSAVAQNGLGGGAGGLISVSVLSLYFLYAQPGLSGLAAGVGSHLQPSPDARNCWGATIRGGAVLECSWLLPIVGWFVLLPASLVVGSGLTTLSLFPDSDTDSSPADASTDDERSASHTGSERTASPAAGRSRRVSSMSLRRSRRSLEG